MADTVKIVLSGYYGFDNIGDEAVLYSIITALKNEFENAELTVLSNNPDKTKALYGVKSVNRWKLKEVSKAIKGCDLLVSGGGSLLQDVTSSKTIPYYLAIVKIAKMYKKKVVFYSQGIGPVNKGFNRFLIKWIVNKVDGIFVRDAASMKLLKEIGIRKDITVAIDPVLGINADKKGEAITSKTVGIYIRPWQDEEHDRRLIESMTMGLIELIKKGYDLCFIPMHFDMDREIAHALAKEVEDIAVKKQIITKEEVSSKIEVVDKNLSIKEVLVYTNKFQFIIGMRLHSLIMAAACNVPMMGISYDPKVTSFMEEIGLPYCIRSSTITKELFTDTLSKLEQNQVQIKTKLKEEIESKKDRIYLPAKCIKQLIDGK